MPNYELLYFEFRGRAEVARLILHYGKIPFKDTRIPREEWPKMKGDKIRFPYGQIPVLLIDGKPLAQSHAIIRYLAPEAGVAGKNRIEAAQIDEIYETCRAFMDTLVPYIRTYLGFLQGDLKQLYKDVLVPAVESQLPVIQDLIGSNGFFLPSGVSYADFSLAEFIDVFNAIHPEVFKNFPKILTHVQRIYNLPELKEYIANRGDHKF